MKLSSALELYQAGCIAIDSLAQNDVQEAFVEAFASAPRILGFSWHQYTPYFNDGDPCVFRSTADEDIELADDDSIDDEAIRQYEVLEAVYNRLPERLLENMFGDGVRVKTTRDGITTDEYSHD